jgi:[ribosomal protein S5]-alanine N-acetyltransferase
VNPPQLELLVADLPTMDAAVASDEALARAIGCDVAEGWAVFTEALSPTRDELAENPDGARWGTRLFVLEEPRTLVGWGGFKGPPADGVVELGYSVAPAFRGRGIASEAVRQMLDDAFSEDAVEAVVAHTLAQDNPSTRVLERTGFERAAELEDPDAGAVWRWRRDRQG